MSLPLTRRIAKAALLTAAGAATVVGASGAAGAAELPRTPDVGSLTNLEGENVGSTLDETAQQVTGTAADTGSSALQSPLPAVGETVGAAGGTAAPAAQELLGSTAGNAGSMVGGMTSATSGAPGTELPLGSVLGATDGLPRTPLG